MNHKRIGFFEVFSKILLTCLLLQIGAGICAMAAKFLSITIFAAIFGVLCVIFVVFSFVMGIVLSIRRFSLTKHKVLSIFILPTTYSTILFFIFLYVVYIISKGILTIL